MTDYMKNQGLVDAATGARNRQRELEAEIERLREKARVSQRNETTYRREVERLRAALENSDE